MAPSTHAMEGYTAFCRLPVELLTMIKECIPPSDLRTHICFYFTCRTTAAIYGTLEEEEVFWKRCCALSGIGKTPQDVRDRRTWKRIAIDCIEKDGFCSHSECGGVLLDWNATRIARILQECPHWDPTKGPVLVGCQFLVDSSDTNGYDSDSTASVISDSHPDEDNSDEINGNESLVKKCKVRPVTSLSVQFSPIFRHLGFNGAPLEPKVRINGEEAFVRDSRDNSKHSPLIDHPIVARSFAMFPMYSMLPTPLFNDCGLNTGERAITVWDVQDNFVRTCMHKELVRYDIRNVFDLPQNAFEPGLPSFRTWRGVWSRCRWYLRWDDEQMPQELRDQGPMPFVEFELLD